MTAAVVMAKVGTVVVERVAAERLGMAAGARVGAEMAGVMAVVVRAR